MTDSEGMPSGAPAPTGRRRNLDDRVRLFAFLSADVVFLLAVLVTLWLDLLKLGTPDGDISKPYDASRLTLFFLLQFVIVIVSVANLGVDIWRRALGMGGRALALFNQENAQLREWAERSLATPLVAASLRHAVALRSVLFVWAAAMVSLASETGGLQNSPFLQFGFTIVVLGMLLTDRVWGRLLLAALAMLLLITVAIVSARNDTQEFYISLRAYFALSFANLFFQLVIVAAGANQLGGLNVFKQATPSAADGTEPGA